MEHGSNRNRLPSRDCESCGKTFQPWKQNSKSRKQPGRYRFCGRACANRSRVKSKVGPRCSVRYLDCVECGALFTSRVLSATPVCGAEQCRLARRRNVEAAYFGRTLRIIQCAECGEDVETYHARRRFCSGRCSRRATNRNRKALKRTALKPSGKVYRAKVYARDGWTCQLCGKPVDKTKAVPHPNAPTLDHIVPLSRGGSHAPENVQCAHFRCNSLKSNHPWNEQLRLVG